MNFFKITRSLSTKFQIPIITGILIGMVLTIVILSAEISNLSDRFADLTLSSLQQQHNDIEKTITVSLRSRARALGYFMAKTSRNFILSFDLDALSELENEAMQDPEVVYAAFLKQDGSPYLSKPRQPHKDLHTERFTIMNGNDVLGYIQIGMSKNIINKNKQLMTKYNNEMVVSIKDAASKAVNQSTEKSIYFILLLTLVMTIFIYYVFYNLISQPIQKLSSQAKDIGRGAADQKIQLESDDELGDLAMSLNIMSESLKESYDKITQTNTELINATIAKDRFLANMTHELRTPLNGVIGLSDLMLIETDENSENYDKLLLINSSGKQLLSIIEQILEITTIQSGKIDIFPLDFEIDPILNELHTSIEKSLSNSGNTFTISVDDNVTDMHSDPLKIKEILANLICNADKFTKNGNIYLSVSEIKEHGVDWIIFRVTDTGVGIEPEALERIFDPFYQADASITRRFGGAGLGLAISQKYCRSLGGEIVAASKPNIGSEFTVKLPRYLDISKLDSLQYTSSQIQKIS